MMKTKRVPPAKERYDAKHPVVSFRVTEEQLKKLDNLVETKGMPRAEIIRRVLQLQLQKVDEIYWRGYFDGFRAGKQLYEGSIFSERCRACGNVVNSVIGETDPDFGLPVSFPKYMDIKRLMQEEKKRVEVTSQGDKSTPARNSGTRTLRKARKIMRKYA